MCMSDASLVVKVSLPFNASTARQMLIAIAEDAKGYNKHWAWWTYDAKEDWYKWGDARARRVQVVIPDPDVEYYGEADTELVFEFDIKGTVDPVFYKIEGEFSSYGGETWDDLTFKEVRPTKIVRQVFENVR